MDNNYITIPSLALVIAFIVWVLWIVNKNKDLSSEIKRQEIEDELANIEDNSNLDAGELLRRRNELNKKRSDDIKKFSNGREG